MVVGPIHQAIMQNNSVRLEKIGWVYLWDDNRLDYRIDQRFYNFYLEVYPTSDIFKIQELLRQVEKDTELTYDDVSFMQLMEYTTVSFLSVIERNCKMLERPIWLKLHRIFKNHRKKVVQLSFLIHKQPLSLQSCLFSLYLEI